MLALALLLAAPILDDKIEAILKDIPDAARWHWGAHVVNLSSGKSVYARNERQFFIPASNTKLFSSALALMRLGPEYRFTTRFTAATPIDENGVLHGDLVFEGGGDPSLSGRPLPYVYKAQFGDAFAPLSAMIDQAYEKGLRRVLGDIVGDDSRYLWDPYPEGWSQDDILYQFGAPVSALILHDNVFRIHLRAGDRPGEPVRIGQTPALPYFLFLNHVRTTRRSEAPVRVSRAEGSRQLAIVGELATGGAMALELAVDDPARYAAFALRELLIRRGIVVDGGPVARHRYPGQKLPEASADAKELALRSSPPLLETLRVVEKVSQNLHAEILIREVSRARGREGRSQGGIGELRTFLGEAAIPDADYHFEDGSGMSRLNLVTPSAIARLLVYMYGTRYRAQWMSLLPIGGEDGSIASRFTEMKTGRVMAKTGTLGHVAALSGYLETARREKLAFSIVVNNANSPHSEIVRFIDKLVLSFVE